MARRSRGAAGAGIDDHYRQVADRLIAAIERGAAPWTQAWQPGAASRLPVNVASGKPYRGMNSVDLASVAHQRGYADQRWGTFKQVRALGGAVRKGEKGARIVYWRFEDRKPVLDGAGRPKRDKEGQPVYQVEPLRAPQVFRYTVFNGDQCDGLPAREAVAEQWDPIEAAEQVLARSGARIEHGGYERACYDLACDRILLPHKEQFANAPAYYQTALHELGHWTGHSSRLNRATLIEGTRDGFGSKPYAREELRAEISSMITGDRLQLGHDPGRHASYVANWIQALRDDPREIYRASKDAQGISDYLLERERFRATERRPAEPAAAKRPAVVAIPGPPEPPRGGQLSMFQKAARGELSNLAARETGRARPAIGR